MDTQTIELASDIAEELNDLISLKDQSLYDLAAVAERKHAARILANAEPIETAEGPVPNYGLSHRAATNFVTPIEQLVLGTNDLCEVKLDFDAPEQDARLAKGISNVFNAHVFNKGQRFNTLWRQSASEGFIVGGGAFYFDDQHSGVYPKFSNRLYFPKDTPLHAEGVTFAIEKLEVSLNQLRAMLRDSESNDKIVDRDKIEALIRGFEENLGDGNVTISNNTSTYRHDDHHNGKGHGDGYGDGHPLHYQDLEDSVREDEQNHVELTLEMWRWWEVRTRTEGSRKGERYVSSILFIDDVQQAAAAGEGIEGRCIIIQDEEAFERAEDWMIFSIQDEETGGEKTVGTIKGIAEVLYTPSVQAEILADRIIEGSLLAATPLLKPDGTGNPNHEDARQFDPTRARSVPEGFDFTKPISVAGELSGVFEMLLGVVAQNSSGDRSNSGQGGELRQQALERQRNSAATKAARILRNYRTLDCLLQMIVAKVLSCEAVAGTEDYCLIKLIQDLVDIEIAKVIKLENDTQLYDEDGEITAEAMKEAADYRKKIVKRKYGYLINITVTAKRNATGIDKASEMEQAQMLLELLKSSIIPEQLQPEIVRYFITLATGNPDWAAVLDEDTQEVMRNQRLVAAIEQQMIMSRAFTYERTGQGLPTGQNDIHSDHLESDFNTVIGLIERHAQEPLTIAEYIGANWILVHDAEHIAGLRRMPKNNGKVREYEQRLAQLQGELANIGPTVQSGAPQQQGQLPDMEQLEAQKKLAEIQELQSRTQDREQKRPIKLADDQSKIAQRDRRTDESSQKSQFQQDMQVIARQDRLREKEFEDQVTVEKLAQQEIETQNRDANNRRDGE